MQTEHHIQLTSAEVAQLWGAYQNDTLAARVLSYFIKKVEDTEIQEVLQYGLELSQVHIRKLTAIFNEEKYPVPQGFLESDVNSEAPRLYSDSYMLYYIQQMGKLGMNASSVAVSLSARQDIHAFFSENLSEYSELHRKANNVLLSKGLYIRPPYLPKPDQVNFVHKKSFLTGWFGKRRPLTSLEAANLYDNIQRNALGALTLTGFSQVAAQKKIRQYMMKGKEIAQKHIEILGSVLRENDLPVPMTWDAQISTSTTAPFSDKLMMFHTTSLISIGIGYYGTSMSTCMRRDLHTHYTRLIAEIGAYAEDGANMMIDNGWLEEPPLAADRAKLVR